MNTARWGTIGLAATAVAIAWLSGRSGDSAAVAAVLQAMASAPVIHVVGIGDRGSRSEEWIADSVGMAYHNRDSEKEEILVDDMTYEYIIVNPTKRAGRFGPYGEPHVQIMPSDMADPKGAARIREWNTGNGILKALREGKSGKGLTVRMVTENGRRLRQIQLPGYRTVETITVDPETDRILRQEMEGPNVIDAPERIRLSFEYPDPAALDRSRFHYEVPAGVSVEDWTDGPVRWAQGDVSTCMNQLKALKEALRQYANDHHSQWPESLRPALDSYVDSLDVFHCPLAGRTAATSYEYHRPGKMLGTRVLAFWNKWKANPHVIDNEAGRLGGVRPGMIECRLHSGIVLSLYYNGYLIRWTPTPERPGVTLAAPPPRGAPPSDSRITALRKALEARERRLTELSVTFDYTATHLVPSSIEWPPHSGSRQSVPVGDFLREHTIWARKGEKMLRDEQNRLWHAPGLARERHITDGSDVFSQYFQRPQEAPHPPDVTELQGSQHTVNAAGELGLNYWGWSFPELLGGRAEVRYAGIEPVGGDRCVVLELTDRAHPQLHARLWFDTGHGDLLRRAQEYADRQLRLEMIATGSREWAPGLFLPARLTTQAYFSGPDSPAPPGTPTHRYTAVVQRVTLGPLPDRLFQPLPAK
jgi:hypothetical protein